VVHTCPTIGSNVEEVVVRKTHFLVWDIGGQEALRSTWSTYYSNTEVRRVPGLWGISEADV
jgi:GTPase SAR1 family protein